MHQFIPFIILMNFYTSTGLPSTTIHSLFKWFPKCSSLCICPIALRTLKTFLKKKFLYHSVTGHIIIDLCLSPYTLLWLCIHEYYGNFGYLAFHSILIPFCLLFPLGFPVPEVSWYRDGQVLSAATLPGVQISFSDGRAKLVIPTVTEANSGRYTVQATNGSGQATSTAELLVTGMKQLEKGTSLC